MLLPLSLPTPEQHKLQSLTILYSSTYVSFTHHCLFSQSFETVYNQTMVPLSDISRPSVLWSSYAISNQNGLIFTADFSQEMSACNDKSYLNVLWWSQHKNRLLTRIQASDLRIEHSSNPRQFFPPYNLLKPIFCHSNLGPYCSEGRVWGRHPTRLYQCTKIPYTCLVLLGEYLQGTDTLDIFAFQPCMIMIYHKLGLDDLSPEQTMEKVLSAH